MRVILAPAFLRPMPRPRSIGTGARRARKRPARVAPARLLSRFGRWALRKLWASPLLVKLAAGAAVIVALFFALNWLYQVARKPAELFFPVSGTLNKAPAETWRQYGPLFREHSTPVMAPELLAALAQVEGAGNPVARTYWRWSLAPNLLEIYRPASSAVGMYQITDGTFRETWRYCIHDHVVAEDGPWNDWRSCWFNSLYARVIPSHAIEMTAAYLDRRVAETLRRQRIVSATLGQKQDLAAVIHLCGAGGGAAYAKRGFKNTAATRCGNHSVRDYLARVNAIKRYFALRQSVISDR